MKKLLFIIQQNPNFPFPGNADVDPPGKPFEPVANIDMLSDYIFLAIVVLALVFLMFKGVYKVYHDNFIKPKKQSQYIQKLEDDGKL